MKFNKKIGKKFLSMAISVAMLTMMFPTTAFTAPSKESTFECHVEHDAECGYAEAVEGKRCSHLQEDQTYSCVTAASPSDASSEECVHKDNCGYAEAVVGKDCTHVCEECNFSLQRQARSTTRRTKELDLTEFTEDAQSSSEGWSWDYTNRVLTLDNVDFEVANRNAIYFGGEPVTFILKGENSIVSNDTKGFYAISSNDDNSDKTQDGSAVFLLEKDSETTITSAEAHAIYIVDGSITIEGEGRLISNGKGGINAKKDISVTGGDIQATGKDYGLSTEDKLIITGGTVTATGQKQGLFATDEYDFTGMDVTCNIAPNTDYTDPVNFFNSTIYEGTKQGTQAKDIKVAVSKNTPAVAFSELTANGVSNTEATTQLTLTLEPDVEGFDATNITLTGASKGILTKESTPGVYKLGISDLKVADGENVTVKLSKSGVIFKPDNLSVAVCSLKPPAPSEERTLYFDGTDDKLYFAVPSGDGWQKGEVVDSEFTGYTITGETLTLNNFSFKTAAKTALYIPKGTAAVVEIKGTSTLSADTKIPESSGITSDGTLVISGDGTLNATGNFGIYSTDVVLIADKTTVKASATAEGTGIYAEGPILMAGANYSPASGAKNNAVFTGSSFLALDSSISISDDTSMFSNITGYSIGLASSADTWIMSSDLKINSKGMDMFSARDTVLFGRCNIDLTYGQLFGIFGANRIYGGLFYGSKLSIKPGSGATPWAALFCGSRSTIIPDTSNMFGGEVGDDSYGFKDLDGESSSYDGHSIFDRYKDEPAMQTVEYSTLNMPEPIFSETPGSYQTAMNLGLDVDAVLDEDYKKKFEESDINTLLQTFADYLPTGSYDDGAPTFLAATSNEVKDVKIYYTTDGSTPTTGSTLYTGGIPVEKSMTIQAITVAQLNGTSVTSNVAVGRFDIGGRTESSNSSSSGSRFVQETWLPNVDGTWKYLESGGTYAKNKWKQVMYNGQLRWYHFGVDTNMNVGWYVDTAGVWYYLNPVSDGLRGAMITGWMKDPSDTYTYYLDPATGAMATGWREIDGKWYYFNPTPNETASSGWRYDTTKTEWVYDAQNVLPYGALLKNTTTPGGYQAGADGSRVN